MGHVLRALAGHVLRADGPAPAGSTGCRSAAPILD